MNIRYKVLTNPFTDILDDVYKKVHEQLLKSEGELERAEQESLPELLKNIKEIGDYLESKGKKIFKWNPEND